jgi:hypothetical protein
MNLKYVSVLLLLLFTSCSIIGNGTRAKHTSRAVRINGIGEGHKIGYETDSAIVYFSLTDLKNQVDKLLNSKKLDPRWDYRTIAQLKKNKEFLDFIKNDILVKHWQNQKSDMNAEEYELAGLIDQFIFKEFLLEGKAELWNKRFKRFEERVIYNFVKDRFGTESAYYTLQNGMEFHRQIIKLGE